MARGPAACALGTTTTGHVKKNLPLLRLSTINPFLLELRRRGVDTATLLSQQGLPTDSPASDELFVAATTIYDLVERSADVAGDRHIGFAVGYSMELREWGPIADAVESAETVGELLSLFAVHAAEHSTATKFALLTEGERTSFRVQRLVDHPSTPAQNDSFYVGFMLRLLKQATASHWIAADVMFRVSEPDSIPRSEHDFRVARGDHSGVQVSFPSRWLFSPFQKSLFVRADSNRAASEMPGSLIASVRAALQPHVHESSLTVERAAEICGHSCRRLARDLREQGTTISKIIAGLRAERAEQYLANSSRRIADIGQSVGFNDPSIFSRAFKNWTGQSPQEFRRNSRTLQ